MVDPSNVLERSDLAHLGAGQACGRESANRLTQWCDVLHARAPDE